MKLASTIAAACRMCFVSGFNACKDGLSLKDALLIYEGAMAALGHAPRVDDAPPLATDDEISAWWW